MLVTIKTRNEMNCMTSTYNHKNGLFSAQAYLREENKKRIMHYYARRTQIVDYPADYADYTDDLPF